MKIKIQGAIIPNDYKWIYDWLEMDSTCPRDIAAQLGNIAPGEVLEVEINSGGGDVFAGSEIYTCIKEHDGEVTVKVVGLAASAASVIAMAGDRILMSPTAQIMIHNCWTYAIGDRNDMAHESLVLTNVDKSIANSYTLRTGMSQKELMKMMDKETWLTAQDAVKLKFADEIMFDEGLQLAAGIGKNGLLPKEVIDKIRNARAEGKILTNEDEAPKPTEEPRQVPVDLYKTLYQNLERRAELC